MSASASEAKCGHCGKAKKGEGDLKKCLRCKLVSYCGKECQKAAWKGHKQTCVEELQQFWSAVQHARAARDWDGVLAWEGKLEEFLAGAGDDQRRAAILGEFAYAHSETLDFAKAVPFFLRKVDVLGACQRFRDQGRAMVEAAGAFQSSGHLDTARKWCKQAQDLAQAHGFYETECNACLQLATLVFREGVHKTQEAVDLLRHALTVTDLVEDGDMAKTLELEVLLALCLALLDAAPEEDAGLEALLIRFQEKAKASSSTQDLEYFGLLGHDLRIRVAERRGDKGVAEKELQAFTDLALSNPRAAGEVLDIWGPHRSGAPNILLIEMREKGQI